MILSYRHKGLAELAYMIERDECQGPVYHQNWYGMKPTTPIISGGMNALRLPGFDFHPLKGVPQRYSVHVNGPWCLTFGWEGENAIDVDLENYH